MSTMNDTGAVRKILVVEDDQDLREMLQLQLERLNYAPIAVEGTAAALHAIEENPDIGIMFSDVHLGAGTCGLDLANRARTIRPGLEVILTSGDIYAIASTRGADAYRFLKKPFTRIDLAAILKPPSNTQFSGVPIL